LHRIAKNNNKTQGGKHREKRRRQKQNRHMVKNKQDQVCSQELLSYETLCDIIQKTLHTEMQKRNPLYSSTLKRSLKESSEGGSLESGVLLKKT
jgi:hypothetical protein